jgi:hypothetical protein
VSPLRKISSWLQHSDSYTPDFFASSDVFINAPFNWQPIVHGRCHEVRIEKSDVSRGARYDVLVAGGQLAKSWQELSALKCDSNESSLISFSRLRVMNSVSFSIVALMRRLFFTYAKGWPGIALLLMRIASGPHCSLVRADP